ncbi:TPA: Signal peptide peptidase-like 2A [Trebouxia sp. C0005]
MTGLTPDEDPTKNGVPLDPPPSTRQGFGRMQLGASLPLSGSSTSMQVVDKVPMAAKGNSQKYCVTGTGGPLKVTLVWHDVPAALSAATQLVNDLDLTVYANSLNGYSVLGNGVSDHLNNVEQVSWDNLDAGLVVIKVTAYSAIQYGPQLYSLVVQGSFTGQLESTYNPAWNSVTTTVCSLPVAHISSAPAVLSNTLSPTFAFTTVDPAPSGFQCKLSGTGGSTTPTTTSSAVIPLQDWTSCSASTTSGSKTFAFTSVSGAGDGTYLFQVRATNYVVQDARVFTLLTTLPQTQISSYSTPESFSSRSAVFSLSTADNRYVTWQCQLTNTGTWDGGLVAGLATVPTAGSVGVSTGWQACTDPQEYLSLPAGSFTFQAQATDLAGNVESSAATTSNSKSWTISLPTTHAIITGGSSGSLYFSNASITFGAYPASASATYQCRLEVYTDSTSLWSVEDAFTACTSPQVYTGLQAGSYRFSAMLTGQNAEYAAQSTFSIDTVGPVVNITSGPATISSGGLISFVFVSEAAAYFQCRWVNVSAGTTTGSFNNCTSPAQRTDLTDGNWVFQVQALATSGVSGATVSFPFLVDSTAPTITEFIVGYTTNKQAVNTSVASAGIAKVPTAAFVVYMTYNDGLLGSGVSNGTYYRLQPEAAQVATVGFKQSNPPLTLSASKGTYLFNTVVADQAGNAATYNMTILSSSFEAQPAAVNLK